MLKPSLDDVKRIVSENADCRVIPVSTEIFSDGITPLTLLRKLKKVSGNCFILESAEDTKKWGRYTFLGFEPKAEITSVNGITTIKSAHSLETKEENPNIAIKRLLADNKSVQFDDLPPFTGGLMGYFAYDYAKYSEPRLNLDAPDTEGWNDVDLMLFDKVFAFDNFRQKIILIVNIPTTNIDIEYIKAVNILDDMKKIIKTGERETYEMLQINADFTELFSKDDYVNMVNAAKSYIKEGDIFQAVLSNKFEADVTGSILDVYRVLRTLNPSPYMFYFSGKSLEIAGASPETLVKLQNGRLHTFPLAGTRPRGKDDEEDKMFEKNLLSDEKELAEHNMLVDLGRNDLGKISKAGSVRLEKYMEILRFSHVMHIGSEVSGEIIDGLDGLDAINAVLPAGTLSGAPKIRAMEIINELEGNKRGIYGGGVGYLDLSGNMDVCIAIRIAYKKGGKVFIRSGAGIVADSDPESEYRECINKALAVRRAIEQAAGGIE
ncbi:MAG: chorismate-binding protein [Oscillospiraceae bacterium]|nr:chorismate-binding protein [Oscillospiraceae bacterium]